MEIFLITKVRWGIRGRGQCWKEDKFSGLELGWMSESYGKREIRSKNFEIPTNVRIFDSFRSWLRSFGGLVNGTFPKIFWRAKSQKERTQFFKAALRWFFRIFKMILVIFIQIIFLHIFSLKYNWENHCNGWFLRIPYFQQKRSAHTQFVKLSFNWTWNIFVF